MTSEDLWRLCAQFRSPTTNLSKRWLRYILLRADHYNRNVSLHNFYTIWPTPIVELSCKFILKVGLQRSILRHNQQELLPDTSDIQRMSTQLMSVGTNFFSFPFTLLIMQPGSLLPPSNRLYPESTAPMSNLASNLALSNFFGTMIAILTFVLPMVLISQHSTPSPQPLPGTRTAQGG